MSRPLERRGRRRLRQPAPCATANAVPEKWVPELQNQAVGSENWDRYSPDFLAPLAPASPVREKPLKDGDKPAAGDQREQYDASDQHHRLALPDPGGDFAKGAPHPRHYKANCALRVAPLHSGARTALLVRGGGERAGT